MLTTVLNSAQDERTRMLMAAVTEGPAVGPAVVQVAIRGLAEPVHELPELPMLPCRAIAVIEEGAGEDPCRPTHEATEAALASIEPGRPGPAARPEAMVLRVRDEAVLLTDDPVTEAVRS